MQYSYFKNIKVEQTWIYVSSRKYFNYSDNIIKINIPWDILCCMCKYWALMYNKSVSIVLQLGQKKIIAIYTHRLVSVKCLPNSYKCTLSKIINLTFCGGKYMVIFLKCF